MTIRKLLSFYKMPDSVFAKIRIQETTINKEEIDEMIENNDPLLMREVESFSVVGGDLMIVAK